MPLCFDSPGAESNDHAPLFPVAFVGQSRHRKDGGVSKADLTKDVICFD